MGRKSIKEDKNRFQISREARGLSREQASRLMNTVSSDRIERIESGKIRPDAYDVSQMVQAYRDPYLKNYYCACICNVGETMIPEIDPADLSQNLIELMAAFYPSSPA